MRRALTFAAMILFLLPACSGEKEDFLIYDAKDLSALRKDLLSDPSNPAYQKLLRQADALLDSIPIPVTCKEILPPSGDKHDYMSQGPYWWPNPDTPNGLPYIRRDGYTNPEMHRLVDRKLLSRMSNSVETLGIAYYFSGNEAYAAKAAQFLRNWFLDPETRMNPHLKYGQRIPGICDGRGIGIIDVSCLSYMLSAVAMMRGSASWTDEDDKGLREWFEAFADWLTESEIGLNERSQPNNHGTYYDLSVAVQYMYVGKSDKAREYMEANTFHRFDQIAADGAQPRELARTSALSYSFMNLRGLIALAIVGEKLGLDFWHYVNANGATLRDAVEWYFPYVLEGRQWTFGEVSRAKSYRGLFAPLMMSAGHYDAERYYDIVNAFFLEETSDSDPQFERYQPKVGKKLEEDRINLLFPIRK